MLTRLTRISDRVRRNAFAFPLAVCVAALMLLINEMAYTNTDGQLRTLVNMGKARIETFEVLRYLSEAESAQRGFLVTGRDDFLQPFASAEKGLMDSLAEQRRLLELLNQVDDLKIQAQLEELARNKLSEMHEVLRLHSLSSERARELMLTGIGQDQTAALQQWSREIIARQNSRIAVGLDTAYDTLLLNRVGIASMTLISLLALYLFIRQGHEIDDVRASQEAQLRAERDRLEAEVARRTAELTHLTQHLTSAREDERARLARDLHDELGAMLTAAKLDVARIRPSMRKEAPDLLPRLAHLNDTLNSGIALKRRIIEDLRPSTLDNLGLQPALEVLCEEFRERLECVLELEVHPVRLTHSAELTVFRMVQEGLTNVAKYAQARVVQVVLRQQDGRALVEVKDDGRGFDTDAPRHTRHGLLGMRYRVEAEGGSMLIQSRPGQGTLLQARLPMASANAETLVSRPGGARGPGDAETIAHSGGDALPPVPQPRVVDPDAGDKA